MGNYTAILEDPNPARLRTESSYPYQFYQAYTFNLTSFNMPACAAPTAAKSKNRSASIPRAMHFQPSATVSARPTSSASARGWRTTATFFVNQHQMHASYHFFTTSASDTALFCRHARGCPCQLAEKHRRRKSNPGARGLAASMAKMPQLCLENQNRPRLFSPWLRSVFLQRSLLPPALEFVLLLTELPTPPLGVGDIASLMNTLVLQMNAKLRAAAAAAQGVVYVDIDGGFEGHRICDVPEVAFQDNAAAAYVDHRSAPFHPTPEGYASMMEAFASAAGFA